MITIAMAMLALVLGIVGGIIHQLYESEQENDINSIIRSLIVGMIASLLIALSYPQLCNTNEGLLILITAGYMGDSIILNFVRRMGKNVAMIEEKPQS